MGHYIIQRDGEAAQIAQSEKGDETTGKVHGFHREDTRERNSKRVVELGAIQRENPLVRQHGLPPQVLDNFVARDHAAEGIPSCKRDVGTGIEEARSGRAGNPKDTWRAPGTNGYLHASLPLFLIRLIRLDELLREEVVFFEIVLPSLARLGAGNS
jgi:hypothetical protein